ncbi:MAG: hypothetical protein LBL58_13515, partial [Tannerellaceae bacterium]|nr:hypothetical protein [Tannerellaceae bacterium]
MPEINLANQTPTRELPSGLPILVGDFSVFVTKVSGSGSFTGEGYVGIPYLGNLQVAVTFKDIVVNTDNHLISGYIETKYDPANSMTVNIDQILTGGEGVGDIRSGEERAAFKVDYTINSNIQAIPLKQDGSKDDIKEGETYTLSKGENGKYTFVLTDSEGKEHKIESETIPATVEDKNGNTFEVNETGEVKPVSQHTDISLDNTDKDRQSDIAVLSFKATANTKYALDEYRDVYEKVIEYKDQYKVEGTAITASAKFMLPGTSDEVSVYIKENKNNKLLPEKVRFITGKGKEYLSIYDRQTRQWIVTVVSGEINDGQELYAVQDTGDGSYVTLGKLNIYTYEPKPLVVRLVPVNGFTNGFTKAAVSEQLNAIYNKVGISCEVEIATGFDYDPLRTQAFNVTGSGLFSTLTDDMKALNNAYMQTSDYKEDVVTLFIIEKVSGNEGVAGDMPRGKQFGYLFSGATAQTVAHEIGHGVFHLDHPFDRANAARSFDRGDLADNLMEYD